MIISSRSVALSGSVMWTTALVKHVKHPPLLNWACFWSSHPSRRTAVYCCMASVPQGLSSRHHTLSCSFPPPVHTYVQRSTSGTNRISNEMKPECATCHQCFLPSPFPSHAAHFSGVCDMYLPFLLGSNDNSTTTTTNNNHQ